MFPKSSTGLWFLLFFCVCVCCFFPFLLSTCVSAIMSGFCSSFSKLKTRFSKLLNNKNRPSVFKYHTLWESGTLFYVWIADESLNLLNLIFMILLPIKSMSPCIPPLPPQHPPSHLSTPLWFSPPPELHLLLLLPFHSPVHHSPCSAGQSAEPPTDQYS